MRMDSDKVGVTLTDQNFQTTVLENPQPVLVAFTAEGCGPLAAARARAHGVGGGI